MTALIHEPFAQDVLTAATDNDLERNLARLYLLHVEAGKDERAEYHARIMQILEEMRARTDAWLAEHG